MTNKPKYLTIERISNIMAAYVIAFGLWVFVYHELESVSVGIISGIMGFAAKHLWVSCNKK